MKRETMASCKNYKGIALFDSFIYQRSIYLYVYLFFKACILTLAMLLFKGVGGGNVFNQVKLSSDGYLFADDGF